MARSADTTVWSNIASTATCKGLGDACDGEVWHAVDSLCAWWLSAFVELRFCDAGMSSPAGALVVCARGSARVARVHVSTQARTTVAAAVLLAIATYLCNGVDQRGGAGLPGCAFPPAHAGRAHATQALKYRAGWGEGSGDIQPPRMHRSARGNHRKKGRQTPKPISWHTAHFLPRINNRACNGKYCMTGK